MQASDLTGKHCQPIRKGDPPLAAPRINELLARQAEVEAEQARWLQLCAEVAQPDAEELSVVPDPAASVAPLTRVEPALSSATS